MKTSFVKKIQTRKLTFLPVSGILALAVLLCVYTLVSAAGPAFDIFPIAYDGAQNTDFPLLDARNITGNGSFSTSQADHDNGVAANPGDILEFIVYYHNGAATAAENIAHNVRVAATLPSGSSQTHNVSASISADGISTVYSSSRGGDVKINVSGSTQPLQYVTGSTKWFPNRATQTQSLPDGIVSGGVSIGDIQGCWEFSGFIKFQVQVGTPAATPALTIQKTVMNVTGNSDFSTSVSANPSDVVRFKIVVTAVNATADNVIIRDLLPSTLIYNSNTTQVNGGAVSDSGGLLGSGYNVGSLASGSTTTVQFDATLASASFFGSSSQTVTNTANARADNVSTVQATATINVSGQVQNSSFELSKSAYNQTQGVSAQSVMANPGDIINYTLTYKNTGNVSISGVVISDDLSGILPYADVVNAGDGSVSGNTVTYPTISVPAGVSISETFQVRVRDVAAGSTIFTMTNTYGNQVSIQIRPPGVKGVSIPPKTGPAENFALIFSVALTAGLYMYRKVRQLKPKPTKE